MIERLAIALCLIVTACGATEGGQPSTTTTTVASTTTSEEQEVSTTEPEFDTDVISVVEQARIDLAGRVDVDESSIEVVSAELVTWSDGSLGCPQPGMMYTQALVDGSRVVLQHDDRFYDYHAGADADPFLCESGDDEGGHDSVPPLEGATRTEG